MRVLAAVRKQNGVEKPTTKNASMAREVMACFVLVSKYLHTVTHRTDTQIIGCAGTRGEKVTHTLIEISTSKGVHT